MALMTHSGPKPEKLRIRAYWYCAGDEFKVVVTQHLAIGEKAKQIRLTIFTPPPPVECIAEA